VRTALKTSINSFLTQMVKDEMLVAYDLSVSCHSRRTDSRHRQRRHDAATGIQYRLH